jgi:Mn-dependent DtxR family transcriptional regulator
MDLEKEMENIKKESIKRFELIQKLYKKLLELKLKLVEKEAELLKCKIDNNLI